MNNKNQTVKVDPITNGISILSEDDRVIFNIRILNGHSIEIGGGQPIKDNGIVYVEGLMIEPHTHNRIFVSKTPYRD